MVCVGGGMGGSVWGMRGVYRVCGEVAAMAVGLRMGDRWWEGEGGMGGELAVGVHMGGVMVCVGGVAGRVHTQVHTQVHSVVSLCM